ncbi:MAG: sensor histidine kinase [Achromobacter pulmonis]|uniref:histidine kinase n=2 Tax=Achromobacter pulmonis TaxID=1389932 RepID=A0A6S7E3Q4_9BURK|nr:HAMP domain-containing sensor histidine kinase [Achromobacter pulmonis]MCF7769437.1 HAMP domain-containing histidine kinase [Achromobacter pulmonis]MPT29048.1 HAMP domain-containing histidine kinase [Achromobacter sp.]CAB3636692.1 Adaptive-response sensory-kinase SasA [Achromobacter pulmonis]CAB3894801.1 Adaptive-response sensory-kinase SasA [Achromobacter pulmonis]
MFRLPLTARIPLAVSLLFLVISAALISLALHGLSRQFDSQVANLGQVYLDGLSAAILPAVRANDGAQMTEVLNRALDTHLGVVDRTLAVVTADHRLLAHVARYPEVEPVPLAALHGGSGSLISLRSEGVWTWRLLDSAQPRLGTLIANLDVSEFLQQRRELALELGLVGLAVSLLGAGLCYGMARRLQRPIISLTQALRAGREDQPREMAVRTGDPELQELLAAYNWMVASVREREAFAQRHAHIEREAMLGRMSAALAHEVRNPLGGLRTAVQTLRQFGDRAEVRQESLGFIDRGVEALQAVVDASLRTFRPGTALLRRADIEDIRLMVRSQAAKDAVRVALACRGMGEQALPLPAGPVRQVLLNLVLNAVQASPPGGAVCVAARAGRHWLSLHVTDSGAGLPPDARSALAGGSPGGDGMGLGIVADLVRAMQGRLRVRAAGPGTRISVRIPLPQGGQPR